MPREPAVTTAPVPPSRLPARLAAQATLILTLALAVGPARAEPPRWHTVETEHFRVHAHEEVLPLALRAAEIAERAYGPLTQLLAWRPAGRIDLTLADPSDDINGVAQVLPRNSIFAVTTPPSSLSSLNEFEDWLSILVTHELTHIVHLDVTLGLARALNVLSGKVFAPNALQPLWFIEGLAIAAEATGSGGGRARSALTEMFLRTASREGGFPSLAEVSNGPLRFPYGATAYLYGGSFVTYLVDRFGAEKIAELTHRTGSRVLPFGFGRAARQTFGSTIPQLWDEWREALARRHAMEAEAIARRGITVSTPLTSHGEGAAGSLAPRFLPEGDLVYYRSTSFERPGFVRIDARTGRRTVIYEGHGVGAPTAAPDGKALIFPRTTYQPFAWRRAGAAFGEWDDLHRLDLRTGALTRLTSGARLHEPALSPDGTTIACTARRAGAVDLVLVPAAGGRARVLVGGAGEDVAYTPSWSPDGTRIVYARWKRGGTRDIYLYDLRDGSDRPLLADRAIDADPQFSPDGRYVLFSSDRTGVYNLYAIALDSGAVLEVTNVLGGAFQPVISPDGRTIVFVAFSARGFDLHAMPYAPAQWRPALPAFGTRRQPAGDRQQDTQPPPRIRRYQPLRHLDPRTWTVTLASDPLGLGASLGVTTSVEDPARFHSVAAAIEAPLEGDLSARVDYAYQRLWPDLTLSLFRTAQRVGGIVVDRAEQTFLEHAAGFSAGVGLPFLRRVDAASSLSFGYVYRDYWRAERLRPADPAGGIIQDAEPGPSAGLYVTWDWNDVRTWNLSVSAQEGRSVQLTLEHASPAVGSRFRTTHLSWSWNEYFTPPWATLQAFALAYRGGWSGGDQRRTYTLGGFAEEDALRAFFLRRAQCCLFVRGYPAGSIAGHRYHALSAEYRAPLLLIERGYDTFPIYLRRIAGALYADLANATRADWRRQETRVGVGGELRLSLKLAYKVESQLLFGAAKGLSKGGVTDYYMVSAFPF